MSVYPFPRTILLFPCHWAGWPCPPCPESETWSPKRIRCLTPNRVSVLPRQGRFLFLRNMEESRIGDAVHVWEHLVTESRQIERNPGGLEVEEVETGMGGCRA